MTTLNSVLTSMADSPVGRNLRAALPTALALGAAGLSPAAAAVVNVAAADLSGGTTLSLSDLGKQLSGIGNAVVEGGEAVVTGLENGVEQAVKNVYGTFENAASSLLSKVGSVASGIEGAIETVAAPVVYGIGALVNVLA